METVSLPLIIFVGSRRAGRMRHLNRLVRTMTSYYEPLKTLTTRQEPKDHDDPWFVRMKKSDILEQYSVDDLLTYYVEGEHVLAERPHEPQPIHYFVVKHQLDQAKKQGRTPIVGMTPEGLAKMMVLRQRVELIPFSAIVLQPEDPEGFQKTLMREYGLAPDLAGEEAERAVRLSSIPPEPPVSRRSSIIPIPVLGTPEDDARIDEALLSLATP